MEDKYNILSLRVGLNGSQGSGLLLLMSLEAAWQPPKFLTRFYTRVLLGLRVCLPILLTPSSTLFLCQMRVIPRFFSFFSLSALLWHTKSEHTAK